MVFNKCSGFKLSNVLFHKKGVYYYIKIFFLKKDSLYFVIKTCLSLTGSETFFFNIINISIQFFFNIKIYIT